MLCPQQLYNQPSFPSRAQYHWHPLYNLGNLENKKKMAVAPFRPLRVSNKYTRNGARRERTNLNDNTTPFPWTLPNSRATPCARSVRCSPIGTYTCGAKASITNVLPMLAPAPASGWLETRGRLRDTTTDPLHGTCTPCLRARRPKHIHGGLDGGCERGRQAGQDAWLSHKCERLSVDVACLTLESER